MPETSDGTLENKRQAGAISASISTYVATAALAVLAGAVALFTYVTQNYVAEDWFYGLLAAGVAALVVAIFLGGKGSAAVAQAVGSGDYEPGTTSDFFSCQAGLTLIGLLLILAATAVGVTDARQTSAVAREVEALKTRVSRLEERTGR